MTRGPLPKKAITLAQKTGAVRGIVRDVAEVQEAHHDFIIFCEGCMVFVRVKRIRTHVTNPEQIEREFGEDIIQIRRLPQTPVVSREIWVLSPWMCWQFFRVLDDTIVEIWRDGVPVIPAVPAAVAGKTPASMAPVVTGNAVVPVPGMTGNTSAPMPGTDVTGSSRTRERPVITSPAINGDAPATPSVADITPPVHMVTPG